MKQRLSILGVILVVVMVGHVRASTIYVTPDGAEGGGTWSTPTSLANALTICTAADEIWLAEGTYTNSATFTVGADRTLYGGFTNGMATRGERDWDAYPSILDGQAANRRVVTVSGANVLLDGLVITNSLGTAAGGITKAVVGALTLANCRLVNHTGGTHGIGGSFTAGSVVMTNCLVAKNVENGYYKHGWGVYSVGVDLELVDCEFSNNSRTGLRGTKGLGLYFDKGKLRALRTDFIDNRGPANGAGPTSQEGGAVFLGNNASTDASFSNCLFRGNQALLSDGGSFGYGPAMCLILHSAATARVVNCTFTDNVNVKGDSGAIYLTGGTLILKNSILWSNIVATGYIGSDIYNNGGTLDISFCDLTSTEYPYVVGATIPLNCRARDPLFASTNDWHLQSPAGRWDPEISDFATTDVTYSPCINGGDPADGIGDEPADNGNNRINMGRYGGTAQASKSPPTAVPLPEDLGSNVHYNRAELTGQFTNETFISAHVYLCYGTTSIPGNTTNGWDGVAYIGEKQSGAAFSTWTPTLSPETTYFYRWVAVNGVGGNWTAVGSFDTGPAAASGGADVIHVNRLATGANDGSDWAHAYTSFAEAALAVGGTRTNVWITGDTYREGMEVKLFGSATLVGGFVGTEAAIAERTLTNAFGVVTNYTAINGEGAYQSFSIIAGNVAMECLAFTNGLRGLVKGGTGTLAMNNCRLVGNAGAAHGVGGYFTGGSVLMTNCVVADNTKTTHYINGLGIYSSGAKLDLVDCVFSNNSCLVGPYITYRSTGLGLYFDNGTLRAWRTDFIDNKGPANNTLGGAGVYLGSTAKTAATFSNCVFRGNEATYHATPGFGGAMWVNLAAASTARVVNCTFTDNANQSGDGGAIYLSAGTLVLKNSILWSNAVGNLYTGTEIYRAGGTLDANYCALTGLGSPQVVGATLPANCQATDPLFASATDLHIQSKAGRWDPAVSSFVTTDARYSHCIDAGDPLDPIGDEPTDNNNTRINLGIYGGTAQASKSPSAVSPLLADRGTTVNYDHAQISGELTNDTYVSAHVYLCYGTSAIVGDTTNGWDHVIGFGEKQNGAVFSTWTPTLLPETPYHYRWYAMNEEGSDWTAAAGFNTGQSPLSGGVDVIHVDRLATGAGDGADWANACTTIGDGIAAIGGTRTNIWITGDTYGEGVRLTLPQSATMLGGFAGTETAVSERALNAFGVAAKDTLIDGEGSHPCFAITAGDVYMESLVFTNGLSTVAGCGIAKAGSGALTLVNCRLVNNVGSAHGVGGYFSGGSVLMTNCVVANNTENNYYVHGFGIHSSGANLEVVDCVISNNSNLSYRGSRGLGLYFDNGALRVWRTDFIDNIGPANAGGAGAKDGGAGVYLGTSANTSAIFSNCVFRGNEARQSGSGLPGYGGAMYMNMHVSTTAQVVNCTFTDNANMWGNGGAIALNGGTVMLKNSILWSNEVAVGYTGSEIYQTGGTLIADTCDLTDFESPYVVGDVTLTNCISVDPLFASATDVHLQSRRGRWHPETSTWVTDRETSPCIDAGDPADPVGLEPLPHGKVINLGAYGGTAQASLTYRPLGTLLLLN